MTAAYLFVKARLLSEEGKRKFAYNDKTGKTVTCKSADPKTSGNLSIGEGINLENGLDDIEIEFLTSHRLSLCETAMLATPWYSQLSWDDPPRASVFLDMAYNEGIEGFLRGFPSCIRYATARQWTSCAAECKVADGKLDAQRYAPLRKILLSGVIPP